MATVRHLGLFPPARFFQNVDGVPTQFVIPCLKPVPIEFADFFQPIDADTMVVPSAFFTETGNTIISPFRVSVEEALAAYWRVKFWRVEFIQSYIGEEIPPPEPDLEPSLPSEKSLVCGRAEASPIPDADEFYPFRQTLVFNSWNNGDPIQRPILINTEEEYFLNIIISGFSQTDRSSVAVTKLEAPLSWRLEGNVFFQGLEEPEGDFVGTSIVEIKPRQWWPYDPGDGDGPIYDEDTGEQLRPFPR